MDIVKKKLILPNGKYLSFSQIVLWVSSPETYRKKYYPDVPPAFSSNFRMKFGNIVTDAMENNEEWVSFIPRFSRFEREELIDFGDDEYEVMVKLFIDNIDDSINKFREQKTGTTVWTDAMVKRHKQLDIYSTALYLRDGFVDDECELVDVRTRIEDNEKKGGLMRKKEASKKCVLTGEVFCIPRIITQEEREECRRWVVQVAKEISEDYQAKGKFY